MILYKNPHGKFLFIHIPKNGGKYIRRKIIKDKRNKIFAFLWGIQNPLDLAHLPWMKIRKLFPRLAPSVRCFTFVRHPYDRCISAFFYLHPDKTPEDLQLFVKEVLPTFTFSLLFHYKIIHYYPQYLFLCTENTGELPKNIEWNKLEHLSAKPPYQYSQYFDARCIEILNDIYKRDFELFHYEKL
jgi:hypothetical protein